MTDAVYGNSAGVPKFGKQSAFFDLHFVCRLAGQLSSHMFQAIWNIRRGLLVKPQTDHRSHKLHTATNAEDGYVGLQGSQDQAPFIETSLRAL